MNKSESKYFNTAVKMDRALISPLGQKPFEYITVSEICAVAEVNRSTFYLHYETIGDLLNETTRFLLDEFLSYFPVDKKSAAYNLQVCAPEELIFICDEYLTPYLSYGRDHREVFGCALQHVKALGFEDVYLRLYENIFNPILDRFHYPTSDKKYVMMYYLNGISAIILEWIKDGCKKSIREISEIITICIFGLKQEP